MIGSVRCFVCGFYLALILLLAATTSVQAVTINLTYDVLGSTPHTLDPAGVQLMAVVTAAADIWEDLIQDPWPVNIAIRWDNLSDDDFTLGSHLNTGTLAGRPVTATIGFDTVLSGVDRAWYFDATPLVHDEYNLTQTVFSVTPTGFTGSTPNVMEVGYFGSAFASQPAVVQNNWDLLTVALHEIGHALGMTSNVATSEVGDGDYDVDPNLVDGATMAISDDGGFHLVAPLALMFPSIAGVGFRTLPSAADVFSVAASPNPDSQEWTSISLERRNFLGGADLNVNGNWLGGLAPTGATDAWVRQNNASPPFTTATANLDTRNFTVQDGSVVNTAANRIRSIFDTTIRGVNSIIRVGNGGELEADNLFVNSGATLRLLDDSNGLQTNVDLQGKLDISNGGTVEGYGNVLFDVLLENDGFIRATDGKLLWFITAAGHYDLDGSGDFAVVNANEGDIMFSGTTAEDFQGTMFVGANRTIDFTFPWVLASEGGVLLNGSGVRPAAITGDQVRVFGHIEADRLAEFRAPSIFEEDSEIDMDDADDQFTLLGDAILRGPQISGDGTLKQMANITVEDDTSIDSDVYDWGNSIPGMVYQTTVEPNVTYTINSPSTGTPDNEHRGTILLSNGVLDVQTSLGWILPSDEPGGDATPGILILDGNNEEPTMPTVQGSELTLGGLLQTTGGRGIVDTTLVTRPTGEIDVQAGAELLLAGDVTYDGPLVHGAGTLHQNANARVISSTTIATDIYDWDGELRSPSDTLISPGATLIISSTKIDVNSPATDGYGGQVTLADTSVLIVNTAGPWRLDGTMRLEGDSPVPNVLVDGQDLLNYGTIEGNGEIQLSIENHGILSPGLSAGVLLFQASFDLMSDGTVAIDLGGLTEILEFDQIQINTFGTANLAGTLEVSLIDGFIPQDGDVFKILTAGAVVGAFNTVTGVNVPAGLDFEVIVESQSVLLLFEVLLPGDFDLDGDVDGFDFLEWQRGFGTVYDSGDLADWQANYGMVVPLVAASAAVPEPTSLILLSLGGILALRRFRRATPFTA